MSQYDSTSEPVECYAFVIDGVGTFYLTSDEAQYTADHVYNPLSGLARNSIGAWTSGEANDFTLTLPANSQIARAVALFGTPRKTTLTFKRLERSAPSSATITFQSVLTGASISGELCTLKFPSPFNVFLAADLPKEKIQPNCNWQLGDGNCKKDLTAFYVDFTGGNVYKDPVSDPTNYRIDASSVFTGTPYSIRLWKGGTLRIVNGGSTEYRTISRVYTMGGSSPGGGDTTQSGDVYLNAPISLLTPTTQLRITPGCDKSWSQCFNYANRQNFGGFPYLATEKLNSFRVNLSRPRKN